MVDEESERNAEVVLVEEEEVRLGKVEGSGERDDEAARLRVTPDGLGGLDDESELLDDLRRANGAAWVSSWTSRRLLDLLRAENSRRTLSRLTGLPSAWLANPPEKVAGHTCRARLARALDRRRVAGSSS